MRIHTFSLKKNNAEATTEGRYLNTKYNIKQ